MHLKSALLEPSCNYCDTAPSSPGGRGDVRNACRCAAKRDLKRIVLGRGGISCACRRALFVWQARRSTCGGATVAANVEGALSFALRAVARAGGTV